MVSAGRVTRSAGLVVAVGLLVLVCLLSIAVGARSIPLPEVWQALWTRDGSTESLVIHDLRIPRTLIGLGVGAALGLAGALMQALTRNPLADPGLLGVNLGASAAVVIGIGWFGVGSAAGYVWFAFAGAAVASVLVFLLGSAGRRAATPERLVLSGVAISAVLSAFISTLILLDSKTFDQFRYWVVGALAGRKMETVYELAPFLLVGIVLALLLSRALNAVALGEEAGRALGANVGRTRFLGAIAVTLLCGAATAAAGPIGFVGLAVPHMVRGFTGPDQRWLLPYSTILAPVLLLSADILGRVLIAPGELEVGVVTAFLGAPVFILLVRRRKLVAA
ncbi:iron chelate uptake ABC transporter family permease subunit [Crossiella sp. CA-258035]|uniref:FecCD family ABC transporter permease n=1 Tax=Crossiella sp. CA-258035 TaxID=2981138 RepID=UPI0024BCFE61|nr:iron chelate uptake ABC transporter family permease subunit [Crossiella sp. CA-258035]WHT21778.1 iron chelate uptake ABC transporter family permease subunit [Crossiella sp. CA-258035]